jgi:MoxR-like ATPase
MVNEPHLGDQDSPSSEETPPLSPPPSQSELVESFSSSSHSGLDLVQGLSLAELAYEKELLHIEALAQKEFNTAVEIDAFRANQELSEIENIAQQEEKKALKQREENDRHSPPSSSYSSSEKNVIPVVIPLDPLLPSLQKTPPNPSQEQPSSLEPEKSKLIVSTENQPYKGASMSAMDLQKSPAPAVDDLEQIQKLKTAYNLIRSEVGKVIVGMDQVIEELLICIFSRGHCLLIGVPGLAKTLLISTVAKTLNLSFNRIQFTPDLMPADITGTEVIQEDKGTGNRAFKFLKGPIFANVILADEINRTPPKTQAALLEAMQEHQVSAGGVRHVLEQPFFVLATQNPIEQEGTYPLPEAQLDRFMFNVFVNYPSEDEEFEVMKRTTTDQGMALKQIMTGQEILELQKIVRRVPISDEVIRYAMSFSRATRITQPEAPDFIKKWLTWGAGPRASQYLILGGKARALLQGRFAVSTEDIQKVAHPVLRHRLITNFSAEAEGITPNKIIDKLIETLPRNESKALKDDKLPNVLRS